MRAGLKGAAEWTNPGEASTAAHRARSAASRGSSLGRGFQPVLRTNLGYPYLIIQHLAKMGIILVDSIKLSPYVISIGTGIFDRGYFVGPTH